MRTPIVLLKEKNDLWFAGSLQFNQVTSMGKTKEEARRNLELVIADMLLHKELDINSKAIDEEKYIKEIYDKSFSEIKAILSDIDIKDYLNIQKPHESVRTNISIKRGYKVLAKEKGINISELVNKTLSKKLGVKF